MNAIHTVTGAFGFSGASIAGQLVDRGLDVATLTNTPGTDSPLAGRVRVHPLDFRQPGDLVDSLRGTRVIYNTYWVRFEHRGIDHRSAVRNSETLIHAAVKAGVQRIVHLSITNPYAESDLPYFRGKAEVETCIRNSGLSYAILRPAVLFGHGDILINNIAWALRRFPVFGVFGDGSYRLRPIHVDDLALSALDAAEATRDLVVNAVGPESFTFVDLVGRLASALGVNRPVIGMSPRAAWAFGRALGLAKRDVMITWDEVRGLMAGLLDVDDDPLGTTHLSRWAAQHRTTIGTRYHSELARRAS